MKSSNGPRPRLAMAGPAERAAIERARHLVYADELGQYQARPDGRLPDAEHLHAHYIVATIGGELAGFIGITPPDSPHFSVDRFVQRSDLPFPCDRHLYEVRALTVLKPHRGRALATALMYASLRWIEARGGTCILAIGRREVIGLYLRAGLVRVGPSFTCGAVTYDLMSADIDRLHKRLETFPAQLDRVEQAIDWKLDVAFRRPPACFHGGAFFDAIGAGFDDLDRRHRIINADVLDAWFPPAPAVLDELRKHLEWIARTSPPTRCEGLTRAIASARGVPPECILPGAGSSDLIFLALRQWLRPESRVLILDPMYGEYAHVVEKLIRCRVERFHLERHHGYRLDPVRLMDRLQRDVDLFLWVNPNNPTGRHVPRHDVEAVLRAVPVSTRVWIDETYVEYVGPGESLETFAAQSANTIVCKSMSKAYALSGLRAGYLCGPPHLLEDLRPASPPWSVSLPAQIAATCALRETDYYTMRHRQTRQLRDELAAGLRDLGVSDIVPGAANFILLHLPPDGPDTRTVVEQCREMGLFLRDVTNMGTSMGRHALRIAVKDADTNRRMLAMLAGIIGRTPVEACAQC